MPTPWSRPSGSSSYFRLAGVERVVDLLRDEALLEARIGDGERLHDVPGGVVRAADITDLALLEQRVERLDGFLERGLAVPFVDLVEVDDVGLQPLQAPLAFADDVVAGKAAIVRASAGRETNFGGEEEPVAKAIGERFTDDLLGDALRINVGGVDKIDARVEAERDLTARVDKIGVAPQTVTAEGGRADAQGRDFQPGPAEHTVFHDGLQS